MMNLHIYLVQHQSLATTFLSSVFRIFPVDVFYGDENDKCPENKNSMRQNALVTLVQPLPIRDKQTLAIVA